MRTSVAPDWREASSSAESGFSLIEVLVTLTILGLMMVALTPLTGRLLHAWSRHVGQADRLSEVATALDRIRRDAAAAFPYLAGGTIQFTGSPSGFSLVTQDISGPQAIVVTAGVVGSAEPTLLRTASPISGAGAETRVALLHSPIEAQFSYYLPSGGKRNDWPPSLRMPAALGVTFLEKGRVLFGGEIPLSIYPTQSMDCLLLESPPPGLCSIRRRGGSDLSPGSESGPKLTIQTPTIAP